MFEKFVLLENSLSAAKVGGKPGFEVRTRLNYYRGIPLSMVEGFAVAMDGTEVPRDKLRFSTDGEDWFTMDEMATVTSVRWEFASPARIVAEWDGNVSGPHHVTLSQSVRTAYIPFPLQATNTRAMTGR